MLNLQTDVDGLYREILDVYREMLPFVNIAIVCTNGES
jgi:hypothetical protein